MATFYVKCSKAYMSLYLIFTFLDNKYSTFKGKET